MATERNEALIKVKMLREMRHLSQDQMAELMQITQSAYARFEAGKTKTDLEILEKFCENVGMSLTEFFIYPKSLTGVNSDSNEVKAQLIIELKQDKKDQVLKLIFGENNLEILNK